MMGSKRRSRMSLEDRYTIATPLMNDYECWKKAEDEKEELQYENEELQYEVQRQREEWRRERGELRH